MKLFTLFFVILTLSLQTWAVDLEQIFAEDSSTPIKAQEAVKTWFKESCGNLSWVLSIEEVPGSNKTCSQEPVVHEVHTVMELSHLKSLFVFWMNEVQGDQWEVKAVYEEHPAWQLCHYPQEQVREDTLACY